MVVREGGGKGRRRGGIQREREVWEEVRTEEGGLGGG